MCICRTQKLVAVDAAGKLTSSLALGRGRQPQPKRRLTGRRKKPGFSLFLSSMMVAVVYQLTPPRQHRMREMG